MNEEWPNSETTPESGGGSPGTAMPFPPEFIRPEIPDHELLRCIGYGSYGQVWLARNVMGVYRAAKVVYRKTFESEKPYEREFQGIQKFEPISRGHESQVDILHIGRNDEGGYFYYVMELADDENRAAAPSATGQSSFDPETYIPKTLKTVLRNQPHVSMEECLKISVALTTALDHLHDYGLVHRDIKPSNIIFVNGLPKLADIGLVAKSDATLSFVGTEGFLPPEGPGKPQADIYSLGKVLYELATGKDRLHFPEPPTLMDERTDQKGYLEFNEVVLRACATNPEERYPDAKTMHQDLVLIQAGKSVRRSRMLERRLAFVKKMGALVTIVAVLALAGYAYQDRQTELARQQAREKQLLVESEQAQRARTEASLRETKLEKIETMFSSGNTGHAMALLTQYLRENPADTTAARRLLSALTYRNFALPVAELTFDSEISEAEISPDGRWIAIGTAQGKISLVDANNGTVEWHLENQGRINALNFSPDGRLLLSAGNSSTAIVRDLSPEHKIVYEWHHPKAIHQADFSPDGNRVVTACGDGIARIWDTTTGEELFQLGPEKSELIWAKFGPNGRRIVTAHFSALHVWDMETQERIASRHDRRIFTGGYADWNDAIKLSPDGRYVAYARGGMPTPLMIWDIESDSVTVAKPPHRWPIAAVDFSPDGRYVATVSNDQTLRLWDPRDGRPLSPPLYQGGGLTWVDFSPNGQWVASASADATIQLWDPTQGKPITEPIPHPRRVSYVQFYPARNRLLSFGGNQAWIWDIRPGAARPVVLPHPSGDNLRDFVDTLEFDAAGERLMTALNGETAGGGWFRPTDRAGYFARRPGRVKPFPEYDYYRPDSLMEPPYARMWNAMSGKPLTPPMEKSHLHQTSADLDASGKFVIAPRGISGATIWNAADGSVHRNLDIKNLGTVWHTTFSPDSRYAITAMGGSSQAILWDVESGQQLHQWKHDKMVVYAEFSPDGKRAVTTSWDQKAKIWDVESRKLISEIRINRRALWARFSPDGKKVVVPEYWRFRLYSADTGEALTPYAEHGFLLGAKFSPDGRQLLTYSFDQTARLWDVESGELTTRPIQHRWLVAAADFSSNEFEIATGSWDKMVKFSNRETGRTLMEPLPHDDWVLALTYHPDGNWLATGCADGNARIWEIVQAPGPVPEWLLAIAEAVGGYHVNESGNINRVGSCKELIQQRRNSTSNDNPDYYTRWAQWFFSDRESRPVSPSAKFTMESYLQRRLAEDSIFHGRGLEECLSFRPADPLTLARLGRKLAVPQSYDWAPDLQRSEWFTRLAVHRAPKSAEAWRARAESLTAADRIDEARKCLKRATDLDPENPNALYIQALISEKSGDPEAARNAYAQAVEITASEYPRNSLTPEAYLNESLRIFAGKEITPENLMQLAMAKPRRDNQATPRDQLEALWLSAYALESAPPEKKAALQKHRQEILQNSPFKKDLAVDFPQSQTVHIGEPVEFQVKVDSPEPLAFDWRHNGQPVQETSRNSLEISDATPKDTGTYSVSIRGKNPLARISENGPEFLLFARDGDLIHGGLQYTVYPTIPESGKPDFTVDKLAADPNSLPLPDLSEILPRAETPNVPAYSGATLKGFLIPPEDGDYVFYLSCDDQAVLFLGDSANPESKRQIAARTSWDQPRNWQTNPSNPNHSQPIHLEKNHRYFIEGLALNKRGNGHLGIAWQKPSDPAPPQNNAYPIPGSFLASPANTASPE